MESPVIQGQEPLTASMLAAAPLMDQKQLLGVASFIAALFSLFYVDWSNMCLLVRSLFAVIHRWATVPIDPRPSPKLGWKNHWDAAGDRQLGAAAHAGVARVPAL